jgi:hypothetical protein
VDYIKKLKRDQEEVRRTKMENRKLLLKIQVGIPVACKPFGSF